MALSGILIDTNGYSAFKRGLAQAVEVVGHVPLIAFSPVVLGELYGGFAYGSREEGNRKALESFLASERTEILTVGKFEAGIYARIFPS